MFSMDILINILCLTPGKTIRDILKDAFLPLYEQENELNEVTAKMADATPEELEDLT